MHCVFCILWSRSRGAIRKSLSDPTHPYLRDPLLFLSVNQVHALYRINPKCHIWLYHIVLEDIYRRKRLYILGWLWFALSEKGFVANRKDCASLLWLMANGYKLFLAALNGLLHVAKIRKSIIAIGFGLLALVTILCCTSQRRAWLMAIENWSSDYGLLHMAKKSTANGYSIWL